MLLYRVTPVMIFTLFYMVSFTVAQATNPDGPGSCNVVCNCNSGPASSNEVEGDPVSQGMPGKRGSKGELGPTGPKGVKGEMGTKGQKGNDADGALISNILGILNAESCDELRVDHDVTTSGYYLLKNRRKPTPTYVLCDFTVYEGVSSCNNLTELYNITVEGYYLFGMKSNEIGNFQFCSPVIVGVYSCQRLQERYLTSESGFYKFQTPGMEPFRVYCDFSESPAATEVHHNLMGERRSEATCETAKCYSVNPDYGATQLDLAKIVDNSVTCKQFIKLKCRGVSLTTHARWKSQSHEEMKYWGGATRNGYCACGETGTCLRTNKKCNCDSNDLHVVTSDEGYLTDKSKLPVSRILLGDMGDAGEESWYTLGKLVCIGQS